MESIPKTRPRNVTPFVLEGRWAMDRLDRPTMRWLSKVAKRKHVEVADIIYETVESLVAKGVKLSPTSKIKLSRPSPLMRAT